METQVGTFLAAVGAFWERIGAFLPTALAAILIVVLGLVGARMAKVFVARLLKIVRFDRLAERSGLESFFAAGDYPITLSGVVAGVVYWIIILMAITAAADFLRLKIISDLFERVVLYLPNVIVAVMILILGVLFSRIINRFVFGALKKFNMDNALAIGIICEYVVQVFVWFIALEQLQVNTDLLMIAFAIAFGGVCLAAAIAFGLAGRDAAARLINRASEKNRIGINGRRFRLLGNAAFFHPIKTCARGNSPDD